MIIGISMHSKSVRIDPNQINQCDATIILNVSVYFCRVGETILFHRALGGFHQPLPAGSV
jgi:hypothetical protein